MRLKMKDLIFNSSEQKKLKSNLKFSVGNLNGHFSNKYNRAQRLIKRWDKLKGKMERKIVKGNGWTKSARLAYAVLLMMETGIRIGNESSAEGYVSINKFSDYYNKVVKTYGCTTLLREHIRFYKGRMCMTFLGKKQVEIKTCTTNKVLVEYGREYYDWKENGELFLDITAYELGKFIRRTIGKKFQPKDIRTAKVNLEFIENLRFNSTVGKKSDINKICKEVLTDTAEFAGHTVTVCKSKYVSPILFSSYKDTLMDKWINE